MLACEHILLLVQELTNVSIQIKPSTQTSVRPVPSLERFHYGFSTTFVAAGAFWPLTCLPPGRASHLLGNCFYNSQFLIVRKKNLHVTEPHYPIFRVQLLMCSIKVMDRILGKYDRDWAIKVVLLA